MKHLKMTTRVGRKMSKDPRNTRCLLLSCSESRRPYIRSRTQGLPNTGGLERCSIIYSYSDEGTVSDEDEDEDGDEDRDER